MDCGIQGNAEEYFVRRVLFPSSFSLSCGTDLYHSANNCLSPHKCMVESMFIIMLVGVTDCRNILLDRCPLTGKEM